MTRPASDGQCLSHPQNFCNIPTRLEGPGWSLLGAVLILDHALLLCKLVGRQELHVISKECLRTEVLL